MFATICSTTVAILAAKFYRRIWPMPKSAVATEGARSVESAPGKPLAEAEASLAHDTSQGYPLWVSVLVLSAVLSLVPATILYGAAIAPWIIPGLILGFLTFGLLRGVSIYESFIEGAKDGFQVALRIIPYLVAILVAVGMFRASGAMDLLIRPLGALTGPLGLPADALPMALLRPALGLGRLWHHGGNHPEPRHRTRQLYRLSGDHAAGVHRNPHFMCWRSISARSRSAAFATPWRPP